MKRRNFLTTAGLASTGLAVSANLKSGIERNSSAPHSFNLKYAPHIGMFQQHAGEDVLSQLDFYG